MPLQVLCLAEQIIFTEKCEDALSRGSLVSFKKELEEQLESYTSLEMDSSDETYKVLELKLKALILDAIHFIDIVEQLISENIRNANEWLWQKQLRFYINKKGNIFFKAV